MRYRRAELVHQQIDKVGVEREMRSSAVISPVVDGPSWLVTGTGGKIKIVMIRKN